MKPFSFHGKIKTTSISSLVKNAYTRPFVPRPTNLNIQMKNQPLKSLSNTCINQTIKQHPPTLSLSIPNLSPIDDNKKSNQEDNQNKKKIPILKNLEQYNIMKQPIKKKCDIQNNPIANNNNNIDNNQLSDNINFISSLYLILKEKKSLLENSLNEILNCIHRIEENDLLTNSKSADTYKSLKNILDSLAESFDCWNNDTYATLFNDLLDKIDLLQSCLAQLNLINKNYIRSKSSQHKILTSKSLMCNFKNEIHKIYNDSKGIESPNAIISELQKIIARVLSAIVGISRIRSAICFSIKSEKRHESQVKTTPIGDFSESFLNEDNDKSHQNEQNPKELISEIQEIDKNEENFICRICEEVVPLDLIEEHSALCIKAHQSQYHFYLCGEKLKKIRKKIAETVLSVNWPSDQENATKVIFPVLFYYSLIGIAIDIQNSDCDANSQLETIIHQLTNWEIPEAENKNLKVYLIGSQLVNKKLQFFNEITNAAKKISNTGDLYAIKVIKRENMSQKNQIKAVSAERDIMKRLNSPFIVNFCMYIFLI